jgi:hybrid cluster-associated redox disulfide protein
MTGEINLTNSNSTYVLTKTQILRKVADESPRAAELLADYGLHCISCFFSEYDTLETGARVHGMTDSEVDDMVAEINEQMEKEFKEKNSEFKIQNSELI